MNGSSINYVWANNTTQTTFGTALSQAFSSSWGGMISGSNTTSANAHLRIAYDSITQPTGIAAIAPINGGDANKHFRQGLQSHGSHDSGILFYMDSANYSADIKKQLTAHELGHLWGIEDLYRHGFTNLESIYSQPYAYNTATRHDKNAMYIGLNNPWFDDGTGNGWKRLKSPGVFAVNEWHDGYYFNSNGYWT
ncbi:MAG: hypothetical protein FWG70_04300 [Oscillospiraceae bacterium]|nr:hypothetical protein [Oscillospiraceae bacterium]